MGWLITKYAITAALIVLVSEVAKRSDKLGALIAALPLVTLLAMVWLHVEAQPQQKIANHAFYTFWYVLPTLPMFLAFPWLLGRIGFWPALIAAAAITLASFAATVGVARSFGVQLMP
jgi:F0F1-type ATP synthase assembly protein I